MKNSAIKNRCSQNSAFTLVEILVVIGVLLMLSLVILTIAIRSRDSARDSSNQLRLSAISRGLDHYRNDFNKLPPSSGSVYIDSDDVPDEQWFGCQFLAQAMLGGAGIDDGDPTLDTNPDPDMRPIKYDRNQGYGFRAKKRGQVYGPYIDPSKAWGLFGVAGGGGGFRRALIDYDKQPILYYLADTSSTATQRYTAADNSDGARYYTDKEIYVGGPGTPESASGSAAANAVDEYVMRDSSVDIDDRTDLPEYLLCTQGADKVWWQPGKQNPSDDDVHNLQSWE